MRRDYFTCVFLGLIAGALAFVCFKPLYFTYDAVIPRDFSLMERLLSVLYTLFFVLFLPFFAAFRKKEWVNWGLAAYGLLAYFPLWFYPAPELIRGEDASLIKMAGALVLRAIYAIMQAPFAALSKLIGNSAASKVVYWLLPVAIAWPVIFRIIRFYRRAYLSEQLNPMPIEQTSSSSKVHEAHGKPEVLGTVISAPVTAQTPADITRKNQPVSKPEEPVSMPPSEPDRKAAIKEGPSTKRAGVRAPIRPVHVGVKSPETENAAALEAGPKKEEPKADKVIELGAPRPAPDEAIPMRAPKPKPDEAIPMGAPKQKSGGAIPVGAPKPENDEAITLGAPAREKASDDVSGTGASEE